MSPSHFALIKATDPDEVEAASRRLFPDSTSGGTPLLPFNPHAPVETTRANLPHWRQDETTYFVTFRLADSLPKEKLAQWKKDRDAWLRDHPEPLTEEQKAEYYETFGKKLEHWLDQGSGSCILRDTDAHSIVENALKHFDGERYHLGEHVIAGNHVHALVTPIAEHALSDILHSWKSFTAKELLKLPVADQLTTAPTVWQKESYDHIVRSSAALAKIEEYIRAHEGRSGVPPLSSESFLSEEDKRRDAASTLANQACEPLASNPALRDLLEAKRRKADVTIDHLTGDTLISAGYDEEKARQLVTSWKQFLEDNQDEITALQILYNRPHAKRHLVYEELKTLAEAIARPPYHIAPAEVWKAYEHLEKRPLTTDPVKTLTNLITLVRHTVDPQKTPLAPFPDLVEERFQRWLTQQQSRSGVPPLVSDQNSNAPPLAPNPKSGGTPLPRFTESQIHWLEVIKNYVALNGAFATDDQNAYLDAWQSVDSDEGVPLAVANRVFGKDALKPIIEELNEVLVA